MFIFGFYTFGFFGTNQVSSYEETILRWAQPLYGKMLINEMNQEEYNFIILFVLTRLYF